MFEKRSKTIVGESMAIAPSLIRGIFDVESTYVFLILS